MEWVGTWNSMGTEIEKVPNWNGMATVSWSGLVLLLLGDQHGRRRQRSGQARRSSVLAKLYWSIELKLVYRRHTVNLLMSRASRFFYSMEVFIITFICDVLPSQNLQNLIIFFLWNSITFSKTVFFFWYKNKVIKDESRHFFIVSTWNTEWIYPHRYSWHFYYL